MTLPSGAATRWRPYPSSVEHRWRRGRPDCGLYEATKYAVEAMAEALATEAARFGINVTMIEPGAFNTDFMSESSMKHSPTVSKHLRVLREAGFVKSTVDAQRRLKPMGAWVRLEPR